MGSQNVISGYKHAKLKADDIIPADARYLSPLYETRMVGWIHDLKPISVLVGHAVLMPVYKKISKRVKQVPEGRGIKDNVPRSKTAKKK